MRERAPPPHLLVSAGGGDSDKKSGTPLFIFGSTGVRHHAHALHPAPHTRSFARDPAHDGKFSFYDPWQLELCAQQQCGCQRGMLSLAGAGFAWAPAVPLPQWVDNAEASLRALLERYNLVGLDINYEEGLTDSPEAGASFAEAMAALVGRLKAWRPQGLLISVAPYSECWAPYRALLGQAGDHIDLINWQVRVRTAAAAAAATRDRQWAARMPASSAHHLAAVRRCHLAHPPATPPPAIYPPLPRLLPAGLC